MFNTVFDFFAKNGIKLRSLSLSQINGLLTGRRSLNTIHTMYKHGYHTTW
jgi:hypothetical protein